MPNPCGKTRPATRPYETWLIPANGWKYHVLKKYQTPEKEATNPYARWFCNVEGDFTEMGDVYVNDVTKYGVLIHTDY